MVNPKPVPVVIWVVTHWYAIVADLVWVYQRVAHLGTKIECFIYDQYKNLSCCGLVGGCDCSHGHIFNRVKITVELTNIAQLTKVNACADGICSSIKLTSRTLVRYKVLGLSVSLSDTDLFATLW